NPCRRQSLVGAHRSRRRNVEGAGEQRQSGEQFALAVVEQVITPLDRRAQGLVSAWPPAPGRRDKLESVVEQLDQMRPRERTQPRSDELEGERQPVQAPAQPQDRRSIGVEVDTRAGVPRPVDEQPYRVVAGW